MPIKKLLQDSAHNGPFTSFKPKPNSVYLSIIAFNQEHQVLLSSTHQLPTLPLFIRDRSAYHALTLNSANFHAIVKWSQQNANATQQLAQQQRNFLSHFIQVHNNLMLIIGCDQQKSTLYRHIIEFHKPAFKLLVMLYPIDMHTLLPSPLSRTSRLHWYPLKYLEQLQFLSQHMTTTPSTLTTKLWRQPRSIYHAQTSQLPRGLYLALFYCQASPPNSQRGLQIFLEKHHEHRLPCVPLRLDTQITNAEWEWLQSLSRQQQQQQQRQQENHCNDEDGNNATLDEKGNHQLKSTFTIGDTKSLETYDFLTKEMQERQQHQHLERQQQLAPFQEMLRQGEAQLQSMVGVPVHLKDLFSEDSLCLMYEDVGDPTDVDKRLYDSNENDDSDGHGDGHNDATTTTDDEDDSTVTPLPHRTLKKKTMSIADMFTYGQQQTQHGWAKPVHIRMLVIVKPVCLTPDFPVRPDFDFYPYHVFRSLHEDKLQFATASLESPPPRRQPNHYLSMSDLLNNTIHSSILSTESSPHARNNEKSANGRLEDALCNGQQGGAHPHDSISNGDNSDSSDGDDSTNDTDEQQYQRNQEDDDVALPNQPFRYSVKNSHLMSSNKYLEKRRSFCTTTMQTSSSPSSYPAPLSLIPPLPNCSNLSIEQQDHDMNSKQVMGNVSSSMALLLYRDKDLKGWTGRLLEFDRQRMIQQQHPYHQLSSSQLSCDAASTLSPKPRRRHRTTARPSRIASTCSLPITITGNANVFSTTTTCMPADPALPYSHYHRCSFSPYDPSFVKRLKRWWSRRNK